MESRNSQLSKRRRKMKTMRETVIGVRRLGENLFQVYVAGQTPHTLRDSETIFKIKTDTDKVIAVISELEVEDFKQKCKPSTNPSSVIKGPAEKIQNLLFSLGIGTPNKPCSPAESSC